MKVVIVFLLGGSDHNVRLIWAEMSANPKESLRTLKGHRDYVNAVAFQPGDGSQVN
jgi:hypothetical protein